MAARLYSTRFGKGEGEQITWPVSPLLAWRATERERRERGGLSNFNFKYLPQVGRCPPGLFPFLIRVRGRRLTLPGRNPPEMRREIPSPPPPALIPSFYRRHCGGSRGENSPWQEEERSAMLPVLCPPLLSPRVSPSSSGCLYLCFPEPLFLLQRFSFPLPHRGEGIPPPSRIAETSRGGGRNLFAQGGGRGRKQGAEGL